VIPEVPIYPGGVSWPVRRRFPMINQAKRMGTMMWVCVAGAAVAVLAIVAGVTGAWIILFLVPCMLMMGMMMWMMGGLGRGGDKR
jgi:hypothetical protein